MRMTLEKQHQRHHLCRGRSKRNIRSLRQKKRNYLRNRQENQTRDVESLIAKSKRKRFNDRNFKEQAEPSFTEPSFAHIQIPMRKLLPAAIAVGIAMAAAPSAHAAPDCQAASFSFTACSGSYELGRGQNDVTNGGANNLATQQLIDSEAFGSGTWDFGAKYDGNTTGNNHEGFSVSGLGSTAGSFGFSDIDLATTDLAISLKSAKGYSLYYFEAGSITDASSIAWDTAGTSTNRKGKAQALSHISYYTRITSIPAVKQVQKVPEPAAMSGLLAIGFAAALRKKRAA